MFKPGHFPCEEIVNRIGLTEMSVNYLTRCLRVLRKCYILRATFRGETLTPHPLLVQWSRKSRAIPLLPLWAVWTVQSLSACTRVHFTEGHLTQSDSSYKTKQTKHHSRARRVLI